MLKNRLKLKGNLRRFKTFIQRVVLISILASFFSFGFPITSIEKAEATVSSSNLILNVDGQINSSYSGSGTTWTDLSSSGNNLTVQNCRTGALPAWSSTVGGGSFQLSGGSSCLFRSALTSAPPQNFSLFFWIKPTSFPDTGTVSILAQLARDATRINGEYMFGFNSEGRLNYWDYRDGSYGYQDKYSLASSTKITLNQWQYVGFVKNGTSAKFFIGQAGAMNDVGVGNLAGTSNASGGNVTYDNHSFAIGLDYRDGGRFFLGYIGAIHYYSTALSDVIVTSNYTASLRGSPAIVSSPLITGTATYGSSLSASTGSWKNTPTSYSYQWTSATTVSGTYSAIAGATSSSYSLTSSDVGKFLKVSVTATNADGSTTNTSTASAVIAAKPLTIKAKDKTTIFTGSAAIGSNSYSISSGELVGSDTFTSLVYTYTSLSPSYNSTTAPTNVGTYTITPSAAEFSVGSSSSYVITYETGTLTISRATQASFSLSSVSGVFLTNLRLTTSGGTDTGTVSFSVSNVGSAGCSITSSDSLTSTSAGSCQVVATKLGTTNYLPAYDTRTVTISKANLVLTTSVAATIKYGSTTSATYSTDRSVGSLGIPAISGSLTFETSTSTACNINSATGLVTMNRASGTCSIRVRLSNDTNFQDTSSALVSITPAKADAIIVTADGKTSTYTGSATSIAPTYSVSGLQFQDTVTVTYGYSGSMNNGDLYSFSSTKPTNAGGYSIIPMVTQINSDSYTASATINSGALTISRASRTISPSTYSKSTLKYGESATVTSNATSPSSNGDGAFSYSVGSGCTIDSGSGVVTAANYFGTCSSTTSILQGYNYESATASATTNFTLSKADTITVTASSPSAVTFTGSAASVTPTISVSGLVAGNTATGATYNFARGNTCAQGGVCQVGDTGPAGGKVFYVSSSVINAVDGISAGGTYLEIAPATFSKTTFNWCEGPGTPYTTLIGASTTTIGSGAANTKIMIDNCTGGAGVSAANLTFGGKSDWFLPSYSELVQIYGQRVMLGLGAGQSAAGFVYWSSTESANWTAYSLVPWAGVGTQNKGQETPYLPIRAFSASAGTSYGPSTTAPTNAGSYYITPSALTLAGGITTDYYSATLYQSGELTINKAIQAAFTNYSSLSAILGSYFTIYKFGGSGDGQESLTVSNGTASGCTISNTSLTASTSGTCVIAASKAASENYLQADSTFSVNFFYYVPEPVAPVSTVQTEIAIAVKNSWSANATVGPTITSISPSSGPIGTTVTITGTGFDGVDVIKIGRRLLTSITGVSSTSITGVIPVGASSGPIMVSNSFGGDFSATGFTVTP
jgi:hypothetical protein